jgi:hypothetical protein
VRRLSTRQLQFVPSHVRTPDLEVADSSRSQNPATIQGYETYMKGHNLTPETVTLNHGATGLWIGDKDAKDVVVYYHGQSSTPSK